MIMCSLQHDGIHALGEVGQEGSVGLFEDAVLVGDQATGQVQRDRNDRQRGIENTRGIIRKRFSQRVREIVRSTDTSLCCRSRSAMVEDRGAEDEDDDGEEVHKRVLERHLGQMLLG